MSNQADAAAGTRLDALVDHLLSADGESGADALETIDREWTGRAHPAQRYALATALSELEASGLLAGRARLWALLVIGWTRAERGEAAQLDALTATLPATHPWRSDKENVDLWVAHYRALAADDNSG